MRAYLVVLAAVLALTATGVATVGGGSRPVRLSRGVMAKVRGGDGWFWWCKPNYGSCFRSCQPSGFLNQWKKSTGPTHPLCDWSLFEYCVNNVSYTCSPGWAWYSDSACTVMVDGPTSWTKAGC